MRDATIDDMAAVSEIYNAVVETTNVMWTEVRETVEQRREWFDRQRREGWPVLVAEEGGAVVGFAAYGPFRGAGQVAGLPHTRSSTRSTCDKPSGAPGSGGLLMDELLERARAADVHVMVAAIDSGNESSIRFHENLGFTTVGRMPEIGTKFGEWLDLVLMQRVLGEVSAGRRRGACGG